MAPQGGGSSAAWSRAAAASAACPSTAGSASGDARAAIALLREIRAFRPDVLHLHSTKAGLVGRMLGALLGTPALYTPHGTSWHYTGQLLGRVQLALERALRHVTTTLVSVCPEEASAFVDEVGFDATRVRVVRNGVHVPEPDAVAQARAAARAALGMGRTRSGSASSVA
jgi:hypothetical protein